MRKNRDHEHNRKRMIELALNDSKEFAHILRLEAAKFAKAKGTTETVSLLSNLFCISESTIFRDLKKD